MLKPGMTFNGNLVLFVFKSGKALIWDMYGGEVFTIDNIVYLFNEKCIIYYTDLFNSFPPGRLENIISNCQYNNENYYVNKINENFKMKFIDNIQIISFQPLIINLTNVGYEYILTHYKNIKRHLNPNSILNMAVVNILDDGSISLEFREHSIIDKFTLLNNSEINEIKKINHDFKIIDKSINKLSYKYEYDEPAVFQYNSNEVYKILINIKVIYNKELLPLPIGTELLEPALLPSEMRNRIPIAPYYSQLGWEVTFSGPQIIEWKIKIGNSYKRIVLPIQLIESIAPTIRGTGSGGSVWPVGQA
jgi:hypothetical protein